MQFALLEHYQCSLHGNMIRAKLIMQKNSTCATRQCPAGSFLNNKSTRHKCTDMFVPSPPASQPAPSRHHLEKVTGNHRVRHDNEGLGTKLKLEHAPTLNEPAAADVLTGVNWQLPL